MKTVQFGNPGIIDPRMWSTFGVSAKDGEGNIGKFGTGLKYAIAVMLREGRHISISTGGKEYKFTAEDADFRGRTFGQCMCNGEPLPFTTHLGAEWELWMAYREIASNCMDEDGAIGEPGETTIEADFSGVDHHEVFLDENRAPIYSDGYIDIYHGESRYIYYRGVRALDLKRESCTTINIKVAEITEDRTLKYDFQPREAVARAMLGDSMPDDLFSHLLLHSKDKYEEGAIFDYMHTQPSQRAINAVSFYKKKGVYMMPGLVQFVDRFAPEKAVETKEPDSRQHAVIAKASDFLSSMGHPVVYPVLVSSDLGHGNLGMADQKSDHIYLSDRVLTMGVKQVASTLLEENLHLLEGLKDETYEMQTYLFDQIITMGERLTGEIL